jgi:ABC-type Fe3+-hydroxamate transport system substrate-binding protein
MLIFGNNTNEISKIAPAGRVVSLVPSLTETIASLGAENRLTGVTRFCKYPKDIRERKVVVGGTKDFDIEAITRLKPDVVVAVKEENDKTGILKLAEKLPVVLFNITHIEDAFDMIRTLGKLLGEEEKSGQLVEKIKKEFGTIPVDFTKRKCLYLIWKKPWMAAGKQTFINEILEKFGFENIIAGRYPEVTDKDFEQAEVVLLSSEPFPFRDKHRQEIQQKYPDKNVLLVDGEMFSWYGSRMRKAGNYFRSLFQNISNI